MGGTTCEDATNHTVGVVLGIMGDGTEVSEETKSMSKSPFPYNAPQPASSPCIPLSVRRKIGHG